MLRLAVIGAGAHSTSSHGPALAALREERPEEVELAAVCDKDERRANRYADRFGFARAYTDAAKMFGGEVIDGLVAVTPLERTCELGCELLRMEVPLLLEKPPGRTVAETRRLLSAAEQAGTPHMISFNRRFSPAVTRAREWLQAQPRRPPELILARMLRHARSEQRFVTGTGVHAIDTVCCLQGIASPASVSSCRIAAERGARLYDARLDFPGGGSAPLLIAPQCGTREETYEVIGPDYCVQINAEACSVQIFDTGETALHWRAPGSWDSYRRGGTLAETRAFADALLDRRPFTPDLHDGLTIMRIAEIIESGDDREIKL
jgi:predicted dehydrogenase